MNYTIKGIIGKDTVLENKMNTDNANIAFHTMLGIIRTIMEDAYETSSDWKVSIVRSGKSSIAFVNQEGYKYVSIDGIGYDGLEYYDDLLSGWL